MVNRWDKKVDIVVVGTGFAGLSAAIEAHSLGAEILLVEKHTSPGGNSMIADGGINAVDEERQSSQGIEDSIGLHYKHTFDSGNQLGEPKWIKYLVENSLEGCIRWLEKIGVTFPQKVLWGYGALWPRTHMPAKYKQFKRGAAIAHAMLNQIKDQKIPILFKCKMENIIREKNLRGNVLGIKATTRNDLIQIRATRGVIVATGGFAANTEMVKKHDRRLAELDTTNRAGCGTGEAIIMAQDIGADVTHMDYVQAIPKKSKPPYKARFFSISSEETDSSLLTTSQIFVNKKGERFINEDAKRTDITLASLKQPEFDPITTIKANFYEELAEKLDLPKKNLIRTIENYNSYCEQKRDLEFNKNPYCLEPIKTAPYKAVAKSPARHYTMGGLRIYPGTFHVIDRKEKLIPRLFAAGEVTGGLHGANRLGHNATPDCILAGRLAGKKAANN